MTAIPEVPSVSSSPVNTPRPLHPTIWSVPVMARRLCKPLLHSGQVVRCGEDHRKICVPGQTSIACAAASLTARSVDALEDFPVPASIMGAE